MTKTTPPTLQDLTDLFRLSVGPGMVSTIQRRPYAPRSLTPPPPIPSTSLTSDDRSHSTGTLTYLPSRIKIINIPTRLYACLKADNVKELTKVFDDAMHDGEWNIAAPTGSHVLGIYVVVYGWRYPLVGEWIIMCFLGTLHYCSDIGIAFPLVTLPLIHPPSASPPRPSQSPLQRPHVDSTAFKPTRPNRNRLRASPASRCLPTLGERGVGLHGCSRWITFRWLG